MNKFSLILMAIAFITMSCEPMNKSTGASFTVKGNCGMCEKTIEAAAMGVEGVSFADWDKDTKKMIVKYDSKKIEIKAIHQAIANTGYDTDLIKGNDGKYNTLHSCCQYER